MTNYQDYREGDLVRVTRVWEGTVTQSNDKEIFLDGAVGHLWFTDSSGAYNTEIELLHRNLTHFKSGDVVKCVKSPGFMLNKDTVYALGRDGYVVLRYGGSPNSRAGQFYAYSGAGNQALEEFNSDNYEKVDL